MRLKAWMMILQVMQKNMRHLRRRKHIQLQPSEISNKGLNFSDTMWKGKVKTKEVQSCTDLVKQIGRRKNL